MSQKYCDDCAGSLRTWEGKRYRLVNGEPLLLCPECDQARDIEERTKRDLDAIMAYDRRWGIDKRLPQEKDVTDVSQWEDGP